MTDVGAQRCVRLPYTHAAEKWKPGRLGTGDWKDRCRRKQSFVMQYCIGTGLCKGERASMYPFNKAKQRGTQCLC
jgi:hypothetical protein